MFYKKYLYKNMDYISKIKEIREQKEQLIKENKYNEYDALHTKELELLIEIQKDKEFMDKYHNYTQGRVKEFELLLKKDPTGASKHIEFFNYALFNIKYHHKIDPRPDTDNGNSTYNRWIFNNIIPFIRWFNKEFFKN